MHSREPGKRIDEMLAKLKEREFRITPQRLAILKILAASEGHPSVDDIYREVKAGFPTTSLATVYKTVSLLKELNEALEISFPTEATATTETTPRLTRTRSASNARRSWIRS
jgi:Fur family peroxide stress response transcriptional regulator